MKTRLPRRSVHRECLLASGEDRIPVRTLGRRAFLHTAGLALGATAFAPGTVHGGEFSGKIRKSLTWGMVQSAAREMPLAVAFGKLRECGFDGAQPNLSHVTDPDEWIAASRTSGLIIEGTAAARTEDLEDGIDLTKRLGGDSVLVVARYDQKQPLADNWARCRDDLKAAAPYAERRKILLLVENVWATFLISPFDMARFIDEIGSPWVQAYFDIGNVMRWGVPEHWAQVLGRRIRKVHVKEYDLKKAMDEGMRKGFDVPIGEGSINWPAVRAELAAIGYTGWAAAEVRGGDWAHLADVARRMDRVLDL